jgi:hypothetical protein
VIVGKLHFFLLMVPRSSYAEILSDVERKWRQRRLKMVEFIKPYKRASPQLWWMPFFLIFFMLWALASLMVACIIANRSSLLPIAYHGVRTGFSGTFHAAKWFVETTHPLAAQLWNGPASS